METALTDEKTTTYAEKKLTLFTIKILKKTKKTLFTSSLHILLLFKNYLFLSSLLSMIH